MRYIAVYKHGSYLSHDYNIYTIEKDTGHGYLMNVKTYEIRFRNADIMPSGIYYTENTYIIPETDPWFNYFIFDREITYKRAFINMGNNRDILYHKALEKPFSDHLQTLI